MVKFMNNRIINIIIEMLLLITYLSSLYGFMFNLNKINSFDNILNIGKIISLSAILYLLFRLLKLCSLIGSPEQIEEKEINFVKYLLILISFLFNTYLYEMILNFILFILFEIVLVLLLLFSLIYYYYYNHSILKNNRDINAHKIQINFLSDKKMYFTPYLDYLYFQYNYRRHIGFIKLYIFFGIIFFGLLTLYSNYQTFLFVLFISFLQYLILWLNVIFIAILPMTIFITLKERRHDFKDLFEAYNSNDFNLFQQVYQKFEFRLDLSFRKEKSKVILSYFKAVILANTGKYSEAIELLNSYMDLTLKSMGFRYEFFNLMGQTYFMLNEKEKA